jgi:arsenate reductase-like glutaredoxin family protein
MHDEPGIIEGLLAQPLLVRRPVLEGAGQLLIGFAEPAYARLLETVSGHPRDSA